MRRFQSIVTADRTNDSTFLYYTFPDRKQGLSTMDRLAEHMYPGVPVQQAWHRILDRYRLWIRNSTMASYTFVYVLHDDEAVGNEPVDEVQMADLVQGTGRVYIRGRDDIQMIWLRDLRDVDTIVAGINQHRQKVGRPRLPP